MEIIKGFNDDIKKRLKNGSLKFIGFCSEREIKKLNNKYVYVKTNSTDIVADAFGIPKRDIYVYKKL